MSKFLIFIPTLNEAQNIGLLLKEMSQVQMPAEYDILVLDDNSPDGTGQILDELKTKMPNLNVIHKMNRNGIGGAHKDGIQWAYDHGYKTLVTMDADFTHPPAKIPELFKSNSQFDVVVGSRYLQKNSLDGWNLMRKLLTWTAHILTTYLLGLKYDSTGAFRLYKLDRIHRGFFTEVQSNGYAFFFESLHLLNIAQYKINEIPIALPTRTYGSSKMSYFEALKSIKTLFTIFLFRRKIKAEYVATKIISTKNHG